MTRLGDFSRAGLAALVLAGGPVTTLEAMAAQQTETEGLAGFAMLWGGEGNQYFVKEINPKSMVLVQPVESSDPNYTGEIVYTATADDSGRLTNWQMVATTYPTSDSSQPDAAMSRVGTVDPSSGKFVLEPAKIEKNGDSFNSLSDMMGGSMLLTVEAGNPKQVGDWVNDTTGKYEGLK
jgi:hypothetical protein|tara:strand:- start:18306 stop:18842 length:537 start_codon:yes stop_codon:yes gene_type:complete